MLQIRYEECLELIKGFLPLRVIALKLSELDELRQLLATLAVIVKLLVNQTL